MIVDCAAYRDGQRRPGSLGIDHIAEAVAEPGTVVWIGLSAPDRAEVAAVVTALGLRDLDVDEIVSPHRRPVVEQTADVTSLVVRTAEYDDEREQLELGELRLVFGSNVVLTVRYGSASPLAGVRAGLEAEPGFLAQGVGAIVARVVDRVVEDYAPALDGFEIDVLEVEQDVFSESRDRPTRRLYGLKREILELLLAGDALLDPLEHLIHSNDHFRPPDVHAELTATIGQLDRIVGRARILSDLVAAAVDANLTQVSLQQNNDMRKISAWVAIAAVPTMIAGIYGMNFEHMPELSAEIGYPVVLLFMAAVCGLLHRAFKRSGWL